MAVEIERKFLVYGEAWKALSQGIDYRQGYLCSDKLRTVRVRLVGGEGYVTIKGKTVGATRAEYEYPIPGEDAEAMLNTLCDSTLIEKKRYTIEHEGFHWEVDEFQGDNRGLVIAEIELAAEDQPFKKPAWIGEEVTEDTRYYNSMLAQHPYKDW